MKKRLLTLMIATFSVVSINSQTKVWDFNDKNAFPSTGSAMSQSTTIDHLTFEPAGGSSFGQFNSQNATFADGYSPTQRVSAGGHSYSSSSFNPSAPDNNPLPTQRYISFRVKGNSTIKVWARGGGSGRSLVITDGVSVLGRTSFLGSDNTTEHCLITTATYEGGAKTIYVANVFNANSIFKIEATNVDTSTMSAEDFKSLNNSKVYSNGKTVFVNYLNSKKTQVKVFNAAGSLVKSLTTANDTSFDINLKGLYLVNLESDAGTKSFKVLIE